MNAEQAKQVNVQAQALARAAREAGKLAVEQYLKSQGTFAARIRECIGKPDHVINAWQDGALARFTIEADAFVKANGGSVTERKGEREVRTDGSVGSTRTLKSIQNDASKLKTIMLAFRMVNARVKAGESLDAWKAALSQGSVHTLYAACVNIKAFNHHGTINAEEINRLVTQAQVSNLRKHGLGAQFKAIKERVRFCSPKELAALRDEVARLMAVHANAGKANDAERQAAAKVAARVQGERKLQRKAA